MKLFKGINSQNVTQTLEPKTHEFVRYLWETNKLLSSSREHIQEFELQICSLPGKPYV